MEGLLYPLVFLVAGFGVVMKKSVYVLKEYERGVVLRFGRWIATKEPGLRVVIPFVDELIRIDTRVMARDIPTQDVITRDNVSVKVNAVIYFRVMDSAKSYLQVDDYMYATSQFAQTTLRSVCGEADLDDLLAQRDKLNRQIQQVIDERTATWGIKVSSVEIKDIDLPQEMKRSMAKQAEAERERRAKVIQAEGEYQAAEKLASAAERLATQPAALQLRYLDTLRGIAGENNSTIVFPLPMELIEPFMNLKRHLPAGSGLTHKP